MSEQDNNDDGVILEDDVLIIVPKKRDMITRVQEHANVSQVGKFPHELTDEEKTRLLGGPVEKKKRENLEPKDKEWFEFSI